MNFRGMTSTPNDYHKRTSHTDFNMIGRIFIFAFLVSKGCFAQNVIGDVCIDAGPEATARCVFTENCAVYDPVHEHYCSIGHCCFEVFLPGLNAACGLTSPDQGVCKPAADCTGVALSEKLCDGSLICCTEASGESETCGPDTDPGMCLDAANCNDGGLAGESCANGQICCTNIKGLGKDCGNGGTCQKECCSAAADETAECETDGLVCCVANLGRYCEIPDNPLLEATCVYKTDCPQGRTKINSKCPGSALTCCSKS